jgi:hypothetical protein
MKIHKLLAIQSIIEDRRIPSDMVNITEEFEKPSIKFDEHWYYSASKDEFINIMDMDLTHLIRAFIKFNENRDHVTEAELGTRDKLIKDLKEVLKDLADE